jgi:hypothetical protein
VDFYDDQFEQE